MKLNDKQLNQLQLNIDHILDSGANSIRLLNMFEMFLERIDSKPETIEHKTITDGDMIWVNKCEQCGKESMQVARPGKIQCKYCG